MKSIDFGAYLTAFLSDYLPKQRNVSPNTIASYCYTFKLFLRFCKDVKNINPEKLRLKDLSAKLVSDFLSWLESVRGCSIATRNQRLAAIHSFTKYVGTEAPENLGEFIKIQKIPQKKTAERIVEYLSADDVALVLRQPNTRTRSGRQHRLILCLLYDSACRVQELVDLKVRDVRLVQKKVIVTGKGRKQRELPLTTNTVDLLVKHLAEYSLNKAEAQDAPLFHNQRREQLTRSGITYILEKYIESARSSSQTIPDKVTPHIIRHTKAMHLLQAGIPLHIIQDILGHSDIVTTERYARANLVMKEQALESTKAILGTVTTEKYLDSVDMLEWLSNYAKECTN